MKGASRGLLLIVVASAFAQQPGAGGLREEMQAGMAAERLGRLEQAAAHFEKAIRLAPALAEAHMRLGLVRHRQQKYAEAIPLLEKAVELKPGLTDARALLGFDYLQTGDFRKAIEHLATVQEAEPSRPEISAWLGMAYLAAGQLREAIPRLEAARAAQPQNPQVLSSLARAYAGLAARLQEELVRVAPESAEAHLALAEGHALAGRTEEAAREYQRAAELNPRLSGVQLAIGDLRASAGDYEAAEKAYREELRLSPEGPAVNYGYGKTLVELGRSPEAIRYLQKAVSADSNLGEAWFQLGRAYLDQGDLKQAESAWLRALKAGVSSGTEVAVHLQFSQLYRKMDKPEQAEQHAEQFKKIRDRLVAEEEKRSGRK